MDKIKQALKNQDSNSYRSIISDHNIQTEDIVEYICDQKLEENQIYELLISYRTDNDINCIIIKLASNFTASLNQLKYIVSNLTELSGIVDILKYAINLECHSNFGVVCSRITYSYGVKLNIKQINLLIKFAEEFQFNSRINREYIISYLNGLKGEIEYAPIPSWVSVQKGENLSLLETTNPGKSIEKDEKFDEVLEMSQTLFKSISIDGSFSDKPIAPDVKDAVLSFLSSNGTDKTNVEAIRIFGPSNCFIDRNCISNYNGVGPCRMLECECLEGEKETIENVDYDKTTSWFTGNCDTCLRIIRDKSHAIRYPKKLGGWKGCYCSIRCILTSEIMGSEDEMFRLELLKKNLTDFGIMDRINT